MPHSAHVAHSLCSFASLVLTRAASPLGLPCTFARGGPDAPLRSRGSLAMLVRFSRSHPSGFSPRTSLHVRSRGPRCPAPLTWLTRYARSLLSFSPERLLPSDFPARSLAGAPMPRSAHVAHSMRSFASPSADPVQDVRHPCN